MTACLELAVELRSTGARTNVCPYAIALGLRVGVVSTADHNGAPVPPGGASSFGAIAAYRISFPS